MALGAWRVSQGDMSLTALLIVLMAGTEIFRPLRDLRTVLHQGLNGQAAAHGILTLLAAPESAPAAPTCAIPTVTLRPRIEFQNVRFAYPGGRRSRPPGPFLRRGTGRAGGHRRPQRLRQVVHRAAAAAAL